MIAMDEFVETRKKLSCWQLTQRHFFHMLKTMRFMIFIFGIPVMQVIWFYIAIGHHPIDLHIAIVNQEMNWETKECPVPQSCSLKHMSCRYLNKLPKETIIQDYYPDKKSAIDAVRAGNAWGVIYFNENFTDSLVARIALGNVADEETLAQSDVWVWLDTSDVKIELMLRRDLLLSYRSFAQEALQLCYQNPKLGDIPVQFNYSIYEGDRDDEDPNRTKFVAPGVILTIVFSLAVVSTTSAFMMDRSDEHGDIEANTTLFKALLSNFIPPFVVTCFLITLVLILAFAVFQVENRGCIGLGIMLTLLQGFCGMGFGFLFSACCRLKQNAIPLALGISYPTLFMNGVIWPAEGMPAVLRYVSYVLPLTLATTSLRSIMNRGWNLYKPDVYLGFISSATWILLFIIMSVQILKFKK